MNEIGLSLDTVWMLLGMDAIGSHVGFLDAARLCAV